MTEFITTWGEVFALAMRDAGVAAQGQTPNAQMANDAKMRCNMFLAQWRRRRWLTYHLIDTSFPCDGSLNYTVGLGGDFNIDRPDQIQAAYMRQTVQSVPNQVDYPLRLIHSYEDYSLITLKNMQAGPSWALFLDSSYPLGLLYPWPLASDQFELHILTKAALPLVGNLTDEIILPPEYIEPIYSNTVIRLRAAFQLPPDPVMLGLAKAGLETLRSSNFQVSTLQMPSSVRPGWGVGYNIWADQIGPWRG